MEDPTPHRSHRRYFLQDIPLEEATARWFSALEEAGALVQMSGEDAPLTAPDIVGRVTAWPVWAVASSPHYDAVAMDGIAVRAADTVGATETRPVPLAVGRQAVWVDTGDPMPVGMDAVVMIEHVQRDAGDPGTLRVSEPVAPWQHVRPLGEDIVATELVLPENHRITPADLGACAAAGLTTVPVRRRPKVTIIPTGDELAPIGAPRRPGDIPEFNSLILAALVRQWGGEPVVYEPVPDDFDAIREAVSSGLASLDVVAINAGSSAGDADYTASVIESLGTLQVHGIAVRPGHPVALGVASGKPVMGLPGYPVSAALTAELLLLPLMERLLGSVMPSRPRISANITRKVVSPTGEDEFLRVAVGRVGNKMIATPVQRGAGVVMSLVRADGIVRIPRHTEGMDAGAEVEVELLRPLEEVENTIVAIGSHDLTLDLLASHLRQRNPGLTLSSSHVGSLGGLVALRRGEAHLAGCHLLDEATGQYNVSYVERHLPGTPVVLVNLVGRVQGLMVAPGNPRGIHGLADLARTDVAFVNRQRGSGTRVLLDHKLAEMGLSAGQVRGYRREEFSHLAVAAAVRGGSADTGLGILSAARALGLEFVPLLQEQYDLVIPRVHYEGPAMQPFLELLQDPDFRREVEELGGYDSANMGRVWAEVG
jgi:putative molybdopterin biosynthesis protein